MPKFNSLDDWKIGWWKKGKAFRYCYGIQWMGMPMVAYKTKSAVLRGSRKTTAVNPAFDNWFPNAEYLGAEMPAEFENEISND